MRGSSIGRLLSRVMRKVQVSPRSMPKKAVWQMLSTRRPGCAHGICGANRCAPRPIGKGEEMSIPELKQQLVDCIRMLEQSDIIDYNGHCSIRLEDGRIIINSGSCQRSRLTV